MSPSPRVGIVGGGVIGLSCALALALRGARVVLFEADSARKVGASRRAAGMLGAAHECASAPEGVYLAPMARRALALWPDFAGEVGADIDGDLGYSLCGALCVASGEGAPRRLSDLAQRAKALGFRSEILEAAQARRLEPGLAPDVEGAVLLPDDGQVHPRALAAALERSCARHGVGRRDGHAVTAISRSGDGFRIQNEQMDAVVLATGASGSRITVADAPLVLGEVPVKGQLVELSAAGCEPSRVIRGEGVYIVPRGGRVLVGATSERGRRDLSVDREQIATLRARAARHMPALAGASETAAWAGVRPGAPDGLPLIGGAGVPGIYAALGCYRNGILLAPAVGEAIAQLVVDGKLSPEAAAFDPLRFDNRAAESQSH